MYTILWFANVSEPSVSSMFKGWNHNLTPGKYPKEHIQYSKHGKSLKSRILQTTYANKGGRYTDSWKNGCFNSEPFLLQFIHLQIVLLHNIVHSHWQRVTGYCGQHLPWGRSGICCAHNSLLFPFLFAPTEISVFTIEQWGWLKAYFKRLCFWICMDTLHT
jgi:hypothetical protein